ncbi:hypothetical protein AB0A81_05455 [Streptomyces flaveolus]|uniref:Uncharacterized protein n=1 Tax=Streptomyces flaveolus TaxID=67297 RepID=A0ABV1V7Z3_9ACTN
MSAFASDPGLDDVRDAAGRSTEVDVALHLLDGIGRLSILWTQEILLSADHADQVAQALQRAADQARKITEAGRSDAPTEP